MLFHFCYSVYPQNADINDRNTIGKPALGGLFALDGVINMVSIKPAYLDREAVAAFVSLSVPAMERLVASGVFPAPRQLTTKRVGWLVREVEEWAESRPVSSNLPVANCGMRHAPARKAGSNTFEPQSKM